MIDSEIASDERARSVTEAACLQARLARGRGGKGGSNVGDSLTFTPIGCFWGIQIQTVIFHC